MTGFSPDWLALREPFDQTARAAPFSIWPLAELASVWRARQPDQALKVLDIGCGTGANLRALAPRLGGRQHWTLLDHDTELLDALPAALAAWAAQNGIDCEAVDPGTARSALRLRGPHFEASVHSRRADLVMGDWLPQAEAVVGGAPDLITASALLDLVSAAWLIDLATRAHAARTALLFALSVDGRVQWTPVDADDDRVGMHFDAHQRRDKGLGPALGADAVAILSTRLEQTGARVRIARSDWSIDGAQDGAMLDAMIEGHAAAAMEQGPGDADRLQAWARRRRRSISETTLQIGHLDLLADWP